MLSIKLAEAQEESPAQQVSITRDDTRLRPTNALMDEDCRRELPDYMVVGGMNVDMMDMDMVQEDDRKSP